MSVKKKHLGRVHMTSVPGSDSRLLHLPFALDRGPESHRTSINFLLQNVSGHRKEPNLTPSYAETYSLSSDSLGVHSLHSVENAWRG